VGLGEPPAGPGARPRAQEDADNTSSGPWQQVSRLGNPLFNEVIVPMARKDQWNKLPPSGDSGFLKYVKRPELGKSSPAVPGRVPRIWRRSAAAIATISWPFC
jgi:hypothetical protein